MTWQQLLDLLNLIETDITKTKPLMAKLPPGEPMNQVHLSKEELKQQILGFAPDVQEAARFVREYYLRNI